MEELRNADAEDRSDIVFPMIPANGTPHEIKRATCFAIPRLPGAGRYGSYTCLTLTSADSLTGHGVSPQVKRKI
jgi:hypothetical protein